MTGFTSHPHIYPSSMYLSMYLSIWGEIYYKVLVNMIMEVEKFRDLPSAGWRPRKASGVVQKPESQRADSVDSTLSLRACEPGAPRAGEGRCPSSARLRASESFLEPLFLFYSGLQRIR